ncbi:hypothetical protein QR680_006799 [Steinernema hermaphroditum]|uniref:Uncharacterized protein n=1 Tax=Steinernema hermaphroditum TaxID=289476 RepID=A0AA39HYS1_9BILA|nr:hypothetical protein QR680_006799 [Steinernema hermaphroditum]
MVTVRATIAMAVGGAAVASSVVTSLITWGILRDSDAIEAIEKKSAEKPKPPEALQNVVEDLTAIRIARSFAVLVIEVCSSVTDIDFEFKFNYT